MKLMCLGGAGRICSESARDVCAFTGADLFEKITIGDFNEAAGRALVRELDDPRVDFRKIDVNDREATIGALKGYDLVLDGTTIRLNDRTTDCISAAGCGGINFNGWGEEFKYDAVFRGNNRLHVPGFGMTPGVTNMMAVHAANRLDAVDTVRISHGAYRPIAFSPSIFETTAIEYDPNLPGRAVYEDGRFVQVPPFARERTVELPPPYGAGPQWIIPHSETRTLAEFLKDKGVRLIEVRGTWPPKNMRLVKALYEWGILRNDRFTYQGVEMGIVDVLGAYLQQSGEGTTTDLYGYALHVEVEGVREGRRVRMLLTHTHPASDGSVKGWEGLRAYTRNVGLPVAVAVILMARGRARGTGTLIAEKVFDPQDVFDELKRRGMLVHEKVTYLD